MSWRNRLRSRLRELKETEGTTQADIAERLGKSPSTITNWLNGHREPETLADFEALAHALKVPPAWLLYGIVSDDPELTAMFAKIESLPKFQREAIASFLNSFAA